MIQWLAERLYQENLGLNTHLPWFLSHSCKPSLRTGTPRLHQMPCPGITWLDARSAFLHLCDLVLCVGCRRRRRSSRRAQVSLQVGYLHPQLGLLSFRLRNVGFVLFDGLSRAVDGILEPADGSLFRRDGGGELLVACCGRHLPLLLPESATLLNEGF